MLPRWQIAARPAVPRPPPPGGRNSCVEFSWRHQQCLPARLHDTSQECKCSAGPQDRRSLIRPTPLSEAVQSRLAMRTSMGRGDRLEAFANDRHRCQHRLIQVGIAGDLATQPSALAVQHVANTLQLEQDQFDFLDRSARDAANQRIQVFRRRSRGRLSLTALAARAHRVAPDRTDLGHDLTPSTYSATRQLQSRRTPLWLTHAPRGWIIRPGTAADKSCFNSDCTCRCDRAKQVARLERRESLDSIAVAARPAPNLSYSRCITPSAAARRTPSRSRAPCR